MLKKVTRRPRRRTLKHRRALRRRRITRRAQRQRGGNNIPDDDNTLVDAVADPNELDSLPHPTPVNVYRERNAPDASAI